METTEPALLLGSGSGPGRVSAPPLMWFSGATPPPFLAFAATLSAGELREQPEKRSTQIDVRVTSEVGVAVGCSRAAFGVRRKYQFPTIRCFEKQEANISD